MSPRIKNLVFSRGFWLKSTPVICVASLLSWWGYVQIRDVAQVAHVRARFGDVQVGDSQEAVQSVLGGPLHVRPPGTGFIWRDEEVWIYGRQYDLLPRFPMLSWRITFRKQRVFGPATGDYCVVFSDDGRVLDTTRIGDRK